MMLDLKIQPAQQPAENAAAACEIHGRLHLVNGPIRRHSLAAMLVCYGHGKLSFLDTVRQLKDDAQHNAAHEGGNRINQQHRPDGMQQHRDRERQGEEHDLAADENQQVFSLGPRDLVSADATGGEVVKVVNKVPLDGQESVQQPEVNALNAMKPISFLLRREPAKKSDVDVVVVAVDVRERVVDRVVLPI